MPDLYCIFGNPIAHSRSPEIHRHFADQFSQWGESMVYEARLAPKDNFEGALRDFIHEGGTFAKGANITLPFKEEAAKLADEKSPAVEMAGAANTLLFKEGRIFAHNTDGIGLLRDLTKNLGVSLAAKRILLLGAGGAAAGVIAPLISENPACLSIVNRSADKAIKLAARFTPVAKSTALQAGDFSILLDNAPYDLVINATSASLSGEILPLQKGLFAEKSTAYDMMYGKEKTLFLQQANTLGAGHIADGLGMLIEQAAEAFFLWRGIRPTTDLLRAGLLYPSRA